MVAPLVGIALSKVGGLIWDKVTGEGKSNAVVDTVFDGIDALIETPAELRKSREKREEIKADKYRAKQLVNQAMASHKSVFVAGAQAFIIWTIGFGLAWELWLRDFLAWITPSNIPPEADNLETLMKILFGVLGA